MQAAVRACKRLSRAAVLGGLGRTVGGRYREDLHLVLLHVHCFFRCSHDYPTATTATAGNVATSGPIIGPDSSFRDPRLEQRAVRILPTVAFTSAPSWLRGRCLTAPASVPVMVQDSSRAEHPVSSAPYAEPCFKPGLIRFLETPTAACGTWPCPSTSAARKPGLVLRLRFGP